MTVIDFHTHILPNIDDGSESVENSIAMLRLQKKQGIDHVVLTPHFYARHNSPERFLQKRLHALERMRNALDSADGLPRISLGAEVHFFEGISDFEKLYDMRITGTNSVLIEMPNTVWSQRILDELEDIPSKLHITPIIAHIDRYISPFNTKGIPEKLSNLPVLVQANADFFINRFTSKLALKLLSENKIQLLGSDCHNLKDRPPNLDAALRIIERSLGTSAIAKINALEQKLMSVPRS